MAEVRRLSHVHDQIMTWMITNPHRNLGELAKELGYTQGWLSQVIHSGIFQAKLKERQDDIFGDTAMTVRDRILGLANVSLERLQERVESGVIDNKDLVNCTDKLLDKMGYGGSKNGLPAGTIYARERTFVIRSPEQVKSVEDWAEKNSAQIIDFPKQGEPA